jgi:hypothetical protein
MLHLSNREELVRAAQSLPIIEKVALCISSGSGIKDISEIDRPERELDGWIVYVDEQQRGIAVYLGEMLPSDTPLRRRLNYVTHAQKLARCFGSHEGTFHLQLCETSVCPPDWQVYRVSLRAGALLCASSPMKPELVFHGIHLAHVDPKVVLSLQAYAKWNERISIGAWQDYTSLALVCDDQSIRGCVTFFGEGEMLVDTSCVQVDADQSSGSSVHVRIDLGEVQLSIEEVATLRAGTKLEVAADFPLRCYLRIGSATLAVGEISRVDGGLRISLKEIIS